jgi:hypothetical protein
MSRKNRQKKARLKQKKGNKYSRFSKVDDEEKKRTGRLGSS